MMTAMVASVVPCEAHSLNLPRERACHAQASLVVSVPVDDLCLAAVAACFIQAVSALSSVPLLQIEANLKNLVPQCDPPRVHVQSQVFVCVVLAS